MLDYSMFNSVSYNPMLTNEFNFDALRANPLSAYLSIYDINELNRIARDPKLSSSMQKKVKMLDEVLKPRGFKRFSGGTNRMVYRHLEDTSIVIKVAYKEQGFKDNYADYMNQQILKPYVPKTYEISPYGVVILCERVYPIRSLEEIKDGVWLDIFYLITMKLIGKYVLEDIGTKYFKNYGIRAGFGVVLLDYSYVYEIDPDKLICKQYIPQLGRMCNGEIDYDEGFNRLICPCCGKEYSAKDLAKDATKQYQSYFNNININIESKGEVDNMKMRLVQGDKTIKEIDTTKQSKIVDKKKLAKQYETAIEKEPKSVKAKLYIGDRLISETLGSDVIKVDTIADVATIKEKPKKEEKTEVVETVSQEALSKLKEHMENSSIAEEPSSTSEDVSTLAGIPIQAFDENSNVEDPDLVPDDEEEQYTEYKAPEERKPRKVRKNINYDEF